MHAIVWGKRGLIIEPQKQLWWMQTHAMVATVDQVKGSVHKVYFSGRDEQNHSHIGYALIDVQDQIKVIEYSREPVISPGELGCFDDSGVTPSWMVNYNNKKYMYYIGWNPRSSVRMSLIAGLAVSNDGGKTFNRYSKAPILERTDNEPFSILTGPCVLEEDGRWRMWYVSGVEWINPDLPRYNIKYAESTDGIHWQRSGEVCIELQPNEHALARPCVVKGNGIYKMFYSYKGDNYRIGYAESPDGIKWQRKDNLAGIDVSLSGWDSEMIEYAFVFEYRGRKYMFYNGNEYGKSGIGYAIQEKTQC